MLYLIFTYYLRKGKSNKFCSFWNTKQHVNWFFLTMLWYFGKDIKFDGDIHLFIYHNDGIKQSTMNNMNTCECTPPFPVRVVNGSVRGGEGPPPMLVYDMTVLAAGGGIISCLVNISPPLPFPCWYKII